jgi:Domain of Unknown Function (DUF1080)
MNIRKMGAGRIACISITVVVAAALAFLVYTPRAASQAGQPAQGAAGAPGAPAGQGGRGGGGGFFTHAPQADYNDEAGFLKLFNGENLDGWTSDGQNWSVKDGSIFAQSTCEHPTGTIYIYSDIGLAGDFDLKVRMKGTDVVNSGIQYRSWLAADLDAPHFPRPSFPGRGAAGRGPGGRGPGRGEAAACPSGAPRGTPPDRAMEAKYGMIGPQYDFDNGDHYPGQFYEQATNRGIVAWPGEVVIQNDGQPKQLLGTLADAATLKTWFHPNDWNDEEVIAEGHTYLHFLNGHLASVFIDNDPTYFSHTGHIGFEIEATGELYIKDIYLKKFAD